jgi:homoserine dehydrogenase
MLSDHSVVQSDTRPHALRDSADQLAPLRIGMLGLGTVGAGTYRVLTRNQSEIARRSGRAITITRVAVRDLARAATIVGEEVALTTDPFFVVTAPDVDVVVEVIGGTTLSKKLVLHAIAYGKHVVTANKALLAEHGTEIFAAAQARQVIVAYEAAVAVSIPIIKVLREGLTANRIAWVAGIINGTSNFILSEMRSKGLDFAAALADAQVRGFAEADPRFDVDGIDAAHKLSLLAANAFGTPVQFAQIHTEGIAHLQAADLAYASQLGYRIKLLGIARRTPHGLELRVHPALVSIGAPMGQHLADTRPTHWESTGAPAHLMSAVEGSMNAVMVKSDAAGITLYYGAGAGSEETASAVIADLLDVARTASTPALERVPSLAFQSHAQTPLAVLPIADMACNYYLRVDIVNKPTLAQTIVEHLTQNGLHLHSHTCLPHHETASAQAFVALTETTADAQLHQVLHALQDLPGVLDQPVALRVEHFV